MNPHEYDPFSRIMTTESYTTGVERHEVQKLSELALEVALKNVKLIHDLGHLPENICNALLKRVQYPQLEVLQDSAEREGRNEIDFEVHWKRITLSKLRGSIRLNAEKDPNYLKKENVSSWKELYFKTQRLEQERLDQARKKIASINKQEENKKNGKKTGVVMESKIVPKGVNKSNPHVFPAEKNLRNSQKTMGPQYQSQTMAKLKKAFNKSR